MSADDIRKHIEAAVRRESPDGRRTALRMMRMCWPGGPEDRAEPVARDWVSRWHPVAAGAALPACSCANGHCAVCN